MLFRSQVTNGSSGNGSLHHLAGEVFKKLTGTQITHVPFKGGGPVMVALAASEVTFAFSSVPSVMPLIQSKRLKAIVVTSAKRSALKPELPTVGESGLPGYERSSWNGLMGPAAMSKDIIGQLQAATEKILSHPQAREQLLKIGLEPNYQPAEAFGAYLRNEVAQISRLMKAIAFVGK